MLFGNRFEKNLLNTYVSQPFNGYQIQKGTAFFDLLCDFCSSVAHNGVVFPNGIKAQDQAKVFYSSYALGIILACANQPESKVEQISKGAARSFANTAMQNGMPQKMVLDRLSFITNCVDETMNYIAEKDSAKQGAYAAISFLMHAGITPSQEAVGALQLVFHQFNDAFSQWDRINP